MLGLETTPISVNNISIVVAVIAAIVVCDT